MMRNILIQESLTTSGLWGRSVSIAQVRRELFRHG
jgi:hypothetical protein